MKRIRIVSLWSWRDGVWSWKYRAICVCGWRSNSRPWGRVMMLAERHLVFMCFTER